MQSEVYKLYFLFVSSYVSGSMMDVVRKIIRCPQSEAISLGRVWTTAWSTQWPDWFCLYAVIITAYIGNARNEGVKCRKKQVYIKIVQDFM